MGKKNRNQREDPFADWREAQDHRYDPGYWLGGRIDPLIRASHKSNRPNKYGWVLLVSGFFTVATTVPSLGGGASASDILDSLLFLAFGVVLIAAGVRMVQPRRGK
jgi:hypothetical protein